MPTSAQFRVWTRRRLLRTMFCSSAALAMNVNPHRGFGAIELAQEAGDHHLLALGDFGRLADPQRRVAAAMVEHVRRLEIAPSAVLLLGDNFYGRMNDGVRDQRWRTGFEEMYPSTAFDCPFPAVLGNHDYTDSDHQVQLDYAAHVGKTRWLMPSRWHRVDLPAEKPVVSVLCLDTNLPGVTKGKRLDKDTVLPRLSDEEVAAQLKWLDANLTDRRAPWTIVMGHHPVYSNGAHGDNRHLIERVAPLLAEHRVPLYLSGHDHDLQHLELEDKPTSFVISGGGGAGTRGMRELARGPFAKPVYGFTHLQVSPKRLMVRHLDSHGNQLHAFEKTLDGKISIEKA